MRFDTCVHKIPLHTFYQGGRFSPSLTLSCVTYGERDFEKDSPELFERKEHIRMRHFSAVFIIRNNHDFTNVQQKN